MVPACTADELHGLAVFVDHHPPAVVLLFVDPAVPVEGHSDQGGLHRDKGLEIGWGQARLANGAGGLP